MGGGGARGGHGGRAVAVSQTVNVECLGCAGTGHSLNGDGVCRECMGQGHIAVDRLPDGRVPPAYREWIIDLMRGHNGEA